MTDNNKEKDSKSETAKREEEILPYSFLMVIMEFHNGITLSKKNTAHIWRAI